MELDLNAVFAATSVSDIRLISQCAARAKQDFGCDRKAVAQLLEIANYRTPLDFARLLSFQRADFIHDIDGLVAHLDRESGALSGLFQPRCAKR